MREINSLVKNLHTLLKNYQQLITRLGTELGENNLNAPEDSTLAIEIFALIDQYKQIIAELTFISDQFMDSPPDQASLPTIPELPSFPDDKDEYGYTPVDLD